MIQRSTKKEAASSQSKYLLGIAYLVSLLFFSLAYAEILDKSKLKKLELI